MGSSFLFVFCCLVCVLWLVVVFVGVWSWCGCCLGGGVCGDCLVVWCGLWWCVLWWCVLWRVFCGVCFGGGGVCCVVAPSSSPFYQKSIYLSLYLSSPPSPHPFLVICRLSCPALLAAPPLLPSLLRHASQTRRPSETWGDSAWQSMPYRGVVLAFRGTHSVAYR